MLITYRYHFMSFLCMYSRLIVVLKWKKIEENVILWIVSELILILEI